MSLDRIKVKNFNPNFVTHPYPRTNHRDAYEETA